jgi:hypothetical protein
MFAYSILQTVKTLTSSFEFTYPAIFETEKRESFGGLDNLFIEAVAKDDEALSPHVPARYAGYQRTQEVIITYYKLAESIISVTVNGDAAFNYKKYLSGESVVDMSDGTSLQCPLYFKYTSTESGHINNLHNGAIYMGKMKKITNFEDEFCAPWRTNGKAYINWCVGPKEAQQKHKGKTSLVFKL